MPIQKKTTRILGVDPGFDRLGIAIIDKDGTHEVLVHSRCITTKKTLSFGERLLQLGKEFESIIKEFSPDDLAIETIFIHTNQKTVIHVAEVRGVCVYFAQLHGLMLFEYSPLQVKMAITGYGRSTKEDIASMLPKIMKTSFPKETLDDELDAIAIALTHSSNKKMSMWG